MKRKGLLVFFILLIPLSGIFATFRNNSHEGEKYLPGELILYLEEGARGRIAIGEEKGVATLGIPSIDALNETFEVYKVERLIRGKIMKGGEEYGLDLLYHLYLPEEADILKAVEAYKKDPLVFDAFPNLLYRFTDTPNDPSFGGQWGVSKIKAPEAWDMQKGDSNVVIGIIDSANDWDHPDLEDNLWINSAEDINGNGRFDNFVGGDINGIDDDGNGFIDDVIGWDFTSNDRNPAPMIAGSDHGTWVSGIANMVTDNGIGGAGVPWNCRTMAFRCETSPGSGFINLTAAINAINYASANGGDVLNMSWGGYSFNSGLNSALQNAHNNGLVLVAAAGNDNVSSTHYPSGYANVIGVVATNSSDEKSSYSNYGTWVDVCAPGDGIYGTENGGGYDSGSGTSASSPIAAGAVGLLRSQNPGWTNFEIENQLFNTCDNIDSLNPGYGGLLGYGRINLFRAIGTSAFSYLTFVDFLINDSSGDNDGRAEFGETINVVVTLQNEAGWQDAVGVTGTLSTSDIRITVTDPNADFGNIPNGTSGTNASNPFVFTVTDSFVHNVTFNLTFDGVPNSYNTQGSFIMMIGHPRLLLVGDDGTANYELWYRSPLDNLDVPFDEWDVNSQGVPPGRGVYGLRDHQIVIWFTGNETTTLSFAERESLVTFLNNGGCLFISGQNIGEDIGSDPFYANYLHASFLLGNANNNLLTGVAGDTITNGLSLVIQGASGAGNADSEDKISPLPGADSIFTYTTVSGAGGLRYDSGVYSLVYFAFPFEAIHGVGSFASRDTVMSRVLGWLCPLQVGVEESDFRFPISDFRLFENFPNPFHASTLIRYSLPVFPPEADQGSGISGEERLPVRLSVFDITGRLVKTLVAENPQVTNYELPITIIWDGRDNDGKEVRSGIYFLRLDAGGDRLTRKATLLR